MGGRAGRHRAGGRTSGGKEHGSKWGKAQNFAVCIRMLWQSCLRACFGARLCVSLRANASTRLRRLLFLLEACFSKSTKWKRTGIPTTQKLGSQRTPIQPASQPAHPKEWTAEGEGRKGARERGMDRQDKATRLAGREPGWLAADWKRSFTC